MLIGHAPIGMDDTPRRRICFKVLAFGRRILRELPIILGYIFSHIQTHIKRNESLRKKLLEEQTYTTISTIVEIETYLLTKDVKLDYPSNKRSDKPSFPSGNARPRLFSLRVYAKAGRRRNVSMEDLRGSRVVAVHTDYETLKSRSMMHDKCFY